MNIRRSLRKRLAKIGKIFYKPPELYELRRRLSYRFIQDGIGIEIGALHCPTPVQKRVRVTYVDKRTTEENRQHYAHYDTSKIVATDIVDNGFLLNQIPSASQDFLIANHVLEHAPDMFGVLRAWARILKPKGFLFIAVPLAERCFDAGRSLTTPEHCQEDHRLTQSKDRESMHQRNRDHYREWFTISIPNQTLQKGLSYNMPSEEQLCFLIENGVSTGADIHFHAFSIKTFKSILHYFCTHFEPSLRIVKIGMSAEAVAILQKT